MSEYLPTPKMAQPCDLYRHYDEKGELLYIGISLSTVSRLSRHRNDSAWYSKIAKIEIQKYDTREEALKAEKNAIIEERPKHNKHHSIIDCDESLEGSAGEECEKKFKDILGKDFHAWLNCIYKKLGVNIKI